MDEYQKQAEKFLTDTNTKFKAVFDDHKPYFPSPREEQPRDIYNITLTRDEREYSFTFGQSLNESGLILVSKGNGKRTGHKPFIPPTKLKREYLASLETGDKQAIKKAYNRLVYWFQKDHFNLGGLRLEAHPPRAYDVLACLQKHEVGTFKDFCADFGYDEDSRTAERVYKAVVEEYENLQRLYNNEELAKMGEIS